MSLKPYLVSYVCGIPWKVRIETFLEAADLFNTLIESGATAVEIWEEDVRIMGYYLPSPQKNHAEA